MAEGRQVYGVRRTFGLLRVRWVLAVIVGLLVVLGLSGSVWAAEVFVTTQLTNNAESDDGPQVSGDRVVWYGFDGHDWEIYTWVAGDSSPSQITDNAYDDVVAHVSGDRVAWYAYDGSDYEIYTWAAGDSSPTQLTDNAYDDMNAQVSGDRVVWYGYDGSDYEVYTWAAGDNSPTQVTDNAYDDVTPQVSGDRVVWYAYDGSDYEIYTWVAGDSSPTQLTDNAVYEADPQVSGDRVVWLGYDGSDQEIFTWAAGDSSPTQVTDNANDDYGPQVSGDRLVWYGYDGSDYEIYTWVAGDSSPSQLTDNAGYDADPRVSDDRVVWYGYSGANYEIYTWAEGDSSPTQVSSNSLDDYSSQVSGDRLVWVLYDGWDIEICTAAPTTVETTVTNVDPSTGPAVGGQTVTITGTNFVGLSGTSAVTFGGTDAAAYTVVSDTQVSATTPAHAAGLVTVQVTGTYGASAATDNYTFVAPAVTVVSPNEGPVDGGQTVTITGTHLTGTSAVDFGGSAATAFTVVDDNTITATTPFHASGLVTVQVTTPDGASAATDNYTFFDNPYVDMVTPEFGPVSGGNQVTISGDRFVGVEDASDVTFGGVNALSYQVVDEETITAIVPAHALGMVYVQVTGTGGSGQGQYFYVAAPTVSSVNPNAGPVAGGQTVTITGIDFRDVSGVTFGGTAATGFTVDWQQITATTPAHAAGNVTVQVTAAGGVSAETNNYTYIDPTPTRFQQSDGRLYYSPAWFTSSYWRYSGGSEKYSYALGASVYIPFYGTRLDWIAKTSTALGIAAVSVDGGPAVAVDLYSPTTVYQKNVWSTGDLPNGLHWVKIVHSGTRNPRSTGVALAIDAVDVVGTLVGATRSQENHPSVRTAGTWSPSWSWSYSGGRMMSANSSGSSVTVYFDGAKLNLLAAKSRYSGKAWVSVDGGPRTLVDLYSYATSYKQVIYSTGFLVPGEHTVTISWSGYKNAASRGYGINVDAFDITGELAEDV